MNLAIKWLVSSFDYDVTKEINFCEACVGDKHHKTLFPNMIQIKYLVLFIAISAEKLAQNQLVGLIIFVPLSMTRHVMHGFIP